MHKPQLSSGEKLVLSLGSSLGRIYRPAGIAVLNGLVLVSYFNQLIAEGLPIEQAVFEGSLRRLRPVLMTASIAALGLVPLLFATGPGSEIQKPLAIVVIGGLITSTALTLVLLPILFRRFGMPDCRGVGEARNTTPPASVLGGGNRHRFSNFSKRSRLAPSQASAGI